MTVCSQKGLLISSLLQATTDLHAEVCLGDVASVIPWTQPPLQVKSDPKLNLRWFQKHCAAKRSNVVLERQDAYFFKTRVEMSFQLSCINSIINNTMCLLSPLL